MEFIDFLLLPPNSEVENWSMKLVKTERERIPRRQWAEVPPCLWGWACTHYPFTGLQKSNLNFREIYYIYFQLKLWNIFSLLRFEIYYWENWGWDTWIRVFLIHGFASSRFAMWNKAQTSDISLISERLKKK